MIEFLWFFLNLPARLRYRVAFRRLLKQLGSVGPGFICDSLNSRFVTPSSIRIGSDVFINVGAHLSGDIQIGNRVLFGPDVTILTGNHMFAVQGKSIRYLHASAENPEVLEKVLVEDEVWVGARSTILGGVTLGLGTVVGACSLVTKSLPPFVLAVGSPCKPIREIFTDDALREHLRALNYPSETIAEVVRRRRALLGELVLPTIDYTTRHEALLGQSKSSG